MEGKICVKCHEPSNNRLPLCDVCKEDLKEFGALATYLNSFDGDKEDLFWIIESEIADRQCSIISSCKVEMDFENGVICLVATEPSGGTLKDRPWLRNKYLYTKDKINEITKLRRALKIAKQYYGV